MELFEVPRQSSWRGSRISQSEGRAKQPPQTDRSIAYVRMNETLKLRYFLTEGVLGLITLSLDSMRIKHSKPSWRMFCSTLKYQS